MAQWVQWLLLSIAGSFALLSVLSAVACYRRASELHALRNKITLQAQAIVELESSLQRTHDLVLKHQRQSRLDENRENRWKSKDESAGDMFRRDGAPPKGASKQELRDYYLKGKNHAEVARIASRG